MFKYLVRKLVFFFVWKEIINLKRVFIKISIFLLICFFFDFDIIIYLF